MNEINLTPDSEELFFSLAGDAGNWSGQPLFDGGNKEKGNLLHLKKLDLVRTFTDEGCTFVMFTEKGVTLAATRGITITTW